jgi:hypothetical protein
MTEKLVAWACLSVLALTVVTFSSHRRWSLDARPILIPIQYVGVWTAR